MGTVTINIDDETEQEFRQTVQQTFGNGKGVLGKAVTEALKKWSQEQKEIREALIILDKGWKLNGVTYKKREELYDRD